MDHVLSELPTMTHLSWVALHGMAHRFIELDKADGETDQGGNWVLLIGRAMLTKSLIQFSIDGQDCVPSLLFDLRPNYSRGNEDNGDILQKVPCTHCCTQCPRPCSRPLQTHTSAGDSWTLTGKSGLVSCCTSQSYGFSCSHVWI